MSLTYLSYMYCEGVTSISTRHRQLQITEVPDRPGIILRTVDTYRYMYSLLGIIIAYIFGNSSRISNHVVFLV